jgi:hypothetical protein
VPIEEAEKIRHPDPQAVVGADVDLETEKRIHGSKSVRRYESTKVRMYPGKQNPYECTRVRMYGRKKGRGS